MNFVMLEDQSWSPAAVEETPVVSDLDVLLDQQKSLASQKLKSENQNKQKGENKKKTFLKLVCLVVIIGVLFLSFFYYAVQQKNHQQVTDTVPVLAPEKTAPKTLDLTSIINSDFDSTAPVATSATGLALALTPATTVIEPAAPSPTKTYLNFKDALSQAQTLTQYLNINKEYAYSENQKNLVKLEKSLMSLSEEIKTQALIQLSSLTPALAELQTAQETITGDNATLVVTAKDGSEGTIEMIRENGDWKIVTENWTMVKK